jgi:hypothetical protein
MPVVLLLCHTQSSTEEKAETLKTERLKQEEPFLVLGENSAFRFRVSRFNDFPFFSASRSFAFFAVRSRLPVVLLATRYSVRFPWDLALGIWDFSFLFPPFPPVKPIGFVRFQLSAFQRVSFCLLNPLSREAAKTQRTGNRGPRGLRGHRNPNYFSRTGNCRLGCLSSGN